MKEEVSVSICVLTEKQADHVHYIQPGCLRDHSHHRHTSKVKADSLVAMGRARWFADGVIEVLAGRTGEWHPQESSITLTEYGTGHIVMQRT